MTYEYYGDMRPFQHQLETIKFMLANKKAYIFLDMGLGKSACSLWFLDMLFEHKKIKKALIISPLSTIYSVWVNEIKKICPYRKYAVVHGNKADRLEALSSDASILITNTDCPRNYEKELMDVNADVIIIDEVTNFAKSSSQRSKSLQKITKRCKAVYGLTGSPVAGGLINSFGLAKVVNPSALPTGYFTRYRDLILYQVNMYEYIPRPNALEIVNKTLSPSIKYRLEDVIDLPPIMYETRHVELPATTMSLFKTMLEHQIAEVREGLITAATAGVKAIRLLQILTGSTKTEDGQVVYTDIHPRLDELLSIYESAGNKLVIFTQSVRSVHIITDFLKSKGIFAEYIYGEVTNRERSDIIDRFQTMDEGVLVAQYKTVSHGITLTKSHVIVFFGPVAGNELYRQAIRRIRRIGQTRRQVIVKMVSTKFEEKIFDKLDNEELTAQSLLDLYSGDID